MTSFKSHLIKRTCIWLLKVCALSLTFITTQLPPKLVEKSKKFDIHYEDQKDLHVHAVRAPEGRKGENTSGRVSTEDKLWSASSIINTLKY